MKTPSTALVLLSGGQDSTTCLAWALERFKKVKTLTFDYGQRHRVEVEQAGRIAKLAGVEQELMKIDLFSELSRSALTHHQLEVKAGEDGQLPTTFVPGRNLIFLSLAAMKAYQLGIRDIVTGVCQTDYSGYPDCREEFVRSLEQTTSLAMDTQFHFHAPLMRLSKADTVKLMNELGHLDWLKESHTCYEGRRPACSKCPACILRLKGFKEAGIIDPLEVES
ncbi:MAG: 7-cyano-7-deazaguanine synthase QueC [bacterium]|nr:7-cyano-7-deazaguanine synthase QueC [bacterium]